MTRVPAPMTSELGSAWGWEPRSCAATIGGKLIPSAPTSWNVSWMLQATSRSLRPTSPSAAIRASTGSMSAAERLTASCSAVSFTSRSRSTAPVVGTGGAEAAADEALVLGDRHVGALEPDPLGAGGQVGKVLAGGAHDVALHLAHVHVRLERSGALGVAEVGEEGRPVRADERDAVRAPEPRQVEDVRP